MRKVFIAVVVALLVVLATGSTALAADPNTTTVNWSGGGSIGGTVTSGNDATVSFGVNVANGNGSFTVTDSNDNPYGYNVDTVSSYIQSNFSGGGETWFQTTRTDSYNSMYGHSGQVVYAYVGSTDAGSMATGSWCNYANMVNCTYGKPKTPGGNNFEASGSSYMIQQFIAANTDGAGNPTDNFAAFNLNGSGTAKVDCMTTEASGCWPTKLGAGGGCYTNADVVATGSGQFQVNAAACNSITTPAGGGWTIGGTGTYGSASLNIIANFTSGFSVADYSVKAQ